jgi:hypothetical protein
MALLVSGILYYQKVLAEPDRQEGGTNYARLVEWLGAEGQGAATVMVGDPPGYWYHGGGPSIVVPNESVDIVLAVADRYGARYLVLDHNRPRPLVSLYEGTEMHPRLRLLESPLDELRIYRIAPP